MDQYIAQIWRKKSFTNAQPWQRICILAFKWELHHFLPVHCTFLSIALLSVKSQEFSYMHFLHVTSCWSSVEYCFMNRLGSFVNKWFIILHICYSATHVSSSIEWFNVINTAATKRSINYGFFMILTSFTIWMPMAVYYANSRIYHAQN